MTETTSTTQPAVVVAAPADETDGNDMPCISCGRRPWGHGYCGELCRRCAELAGEGAAR